MDDQAYNMDVDDLFGDNEHVNITAIPSPPVKGLVKRLDELSASGCCQKIAWSKNGCVAYIAPDGYGVNLRVFSRDAATGKWDLGKDTPIAMPHTQDEFPFVHLSWSHLGNDLAVMDSAGHVLIFSMAIAIDRMEYRRTEISQPEAEMDTVVGLHWLAVLPHEQKNHIAWSATAKGDTWNFQVSSHVFQDAHHPVERQLSLIYLKRHGELKLRFQQTDNSWHEVATAVGPMLSTREPFTHAAFASNNDNTLLLAAYDVVGRLYLYRIETKWNPPPQPKPGHAPKPFEKPEIRVTEITVEENCYPTTSTMMNGESSTGSESRIRIPAQLTHLNFLPVTPEKDDGTLPTIIALFSTPTNIISIDQNQAHQNPYSIMVKWEVHRQKQSQLHPSLDKVTSKKKSVSSVPERDVFLLKRQADMILHSVVLTFSSLWYHMILAFCYSDGTIEFRKRATLEIIAPDFNNPNTEMVTSLSQAGFSFSTLEPAVQVSLSPNHCIAVCMQQDGTTKLRFMEYSYGSLASDDDNDPRHSAAVAALVLQSSTAANQYLSSDDIFAVMGELSEKRKRDFIHLMFQGLNVNIDCDVEEGRSNNGNQGFMLLGRSPTFVKTLSAAHILGLQGSVTRSVTSKVAWMILNIKYITQILTTIARMHIHGSMGEKRDLRPEVVPQLIGICRWIMNFMVYIMDELISLGLELRKPTTSPTPLTRDILEAKIQEMNHPAILILLSSFPRMMMKLWASPLHWVIRSAMAHTQTPQSPEHRRIYQPLHTAVADVPFDYRHFENLLTEAQMLVRNSYKRAQLTDHQRNLAERDLILGRVPDVLLPAARRLLGDSLFNEQQQQGALLDKLDPARIMFFDTTWLGLYGSDHSKEWWATHVVDVCQKMVIRGSGAQSHPSALNTRNRERSDSAAGANGHGGSGAGAGASGSGGHTEGDKKERGRKSQLRKCVRCGAYMEDVTQGMPGYALHHVSWLSGVAKHCVCGNPWMLADEKRRAK
ncbi:mediator complex, subunit Med16 [Clohesyomyces aquaticus]|uniref:Mediator of RNA polymerase II transcription subunit 16 n=1 Tax=Clohesyomyces aquaticus TaxID=1231657 RepID=A0A1Y1ZFP0_9PLEO|nr:mediator complex, subunit Med16 [Clohesyomyces aquaticus]